MSNSDPIDVDSVLWSAPADARDGRPIVVLLHGYGSDERDLFSLVPMLPDEFVYVAVRAPLAPPWPAPGYSWYPIEGLNARTGESVTAGAEALLAWLDTQEIGDVGLLGFSQGAAVAIQALRLRPQRFAFAVNLSGYAAGGELPTDAELAARRPPVFWGRGTNDTVIFPQLIEHTTAWLPGVVELSGRVYTGLGHAVSQDEIVDVGVFLRKCLEDLRQPAATDVQSPDGPSADGQSTDGQSTDGQSTDGRDEEG